MVSPISAVQAGAVASTSSIPEPPRIRTQAYRAHSVIPDWQPTDSEVPILLLFIGIQVETTNLTPLDFFQMFFTENLYQSIVNESNFQVHKLQKSVVQLFLLEIRHSSLVGPRPGQNQFFGMLPGTASARDMRLKSVLANP